jgi:ornithine cyclodeaminase/alanine dehydrogenase-like protein (mu-crystallin family)
MVLVLSEADVRQALTMADGIRVVEDAFRDHANGNTLLLPRASYNVPGNRGAFRIMSAILPTDGSFGLKTLTGYPGLRVAGETYFVVLLFETTTGALRAILAANHLTGIRTGAATAVAAKYLAREDASVLGIFGTGVQARHQVAALMEVRPLRLVKVFNLDRAKASAFANQIENDIGAQVRVADSPQSTVAGSDLVVTATSSLEPVFSGDWLEEGTHVSGVGANSPTKRELDGTSFQRSKVVVDFRQQTLEEAGDLQAAIRTGAIAADGIHAELGEVVTGRKEGRSNSREITLFKSVGVAVEDIAVAAFVYQRAKATGLGTSVQMETDEVGGIYPAASTL